VSTSRSVAGVFVCIVLIEVLFFMKCIFLSFLVIFVAFVDVRGGMRGL